MAKRAEALQPLSRDHHQALVVAQRLRRAAAGDAGAERDRFLTFWRDHAQRHFRVEEEVLLPAFARHGDPRDPVVARVLTDHVELRRLARDLETGAAPAAPAIERLHELGELLNDHVRLEERELFPLIEATLTAGELAELAAAVERAEVATE